MASLTQVHRLFWPRQSLPCIRRAIPNLSTNPFMNPRAAPVTTGHSLRHQDQGQQDNCTVDSPGGESGGDSCIHARDAAALATENVLCQRLASQGLVRAAGADAATFLQGLITNDMRCLHGTAGCPGLGKPRNMHVQSLYAMMLNIKGRLLYDLIIYNVSGDPSQPVYLIEVDKEALPDFLKTLKMYKIRKKVDLANVSDEFASWVLLPETSAERHSPLGISFNRPEQVVTAVSDPRLKFFSNRLVLPSKVDGCDVVAKAQPPQDQDIYTRRRYQLGIAEGPADLPPGECLPLECNAVFLNAVSFNKGCYIGQELTARTHHTGVIRKRLLPIVMKSENSDAKFGDKMANAAGKNSGKFLNRVGHLGLAILRLGDVIGKGDLVIKNSDGEIMEENVTTNIPHWWPRDSDEIIKSVLAKSELTSKVS